jgi:exosortase/archaeosortase
MNLPSGVFTVVVRTCTHRSSISTTKCPLASMAGPLGARAMSFTVTVGCIRLCRFLLPSVRRCQ